MLKTEWSQPECPHEKFTTEQRVCDRDAWDRCSACQATRNHAFDVWEITQHSITTTSAWTQPTFEPDGTTDNPPPDPLKSLEQQVKALEDKVCAAAEFTYKMAAWTMKERPPPDRSWLTTETIKESWKLPKRVPPKPSVYDKPDRGDPNFGWYLLGLLISVASIVGASAVVVNNLETDDYVLVISTVLWLMLGMCSLIHYAGKVIDRW